jgi:predicted nucleic acid-binding protein
MNVLRLYLETSVFNFVFADDAPEKKQDTLKLFEEIKRGKYEPYTSAYAVSELEKAPEPKRGLMLDMLNNYNVTVLTAADDIRKLADIYVAEGLIPTKYDDDALHLAAATVNEMDFIVSYNFQHIVKQKTVVLSGAINQREGYKPIGIVSPKEVIDSE